MSDEMITIKIYKSIELQTSFNNEIKNCFLKIWIKQKTKKKKKRMKKRLQFG